MRGISGVPNGTLAYQCAFLLFDKLLVQNYLTETQEPMEMADSSFMIVEQGDAKSMNSIGVFLTLVANYIGKGRSKSNITPENG